MAQNDAINLDEYLGSDFPSGDGQEGNAVKVLRQKLEAEIKARKGLESEVTTLRQGERTRELDRLFEGVPAKFKDFYGDRPATAEEFAKFKNEYGELWGANQTPAPQAAVPPEQQQQAQAIQQTVSTASQPPAAPLSEEEARRAFANANNMDELMASFSQLAGS